MSFSKTFRENPNPLGSSYSTYSTTTYSTYSTFILNVYYYMYTSNIFSEPYFRKNPNTLISIDEDLRDGLSPEEVYFKTNKNADSPSEVVNLKTVHNRKYNLKTNEPGLKDQSEGEVLLSCIKDGTLVKSVRFDKDRYVAILFEDYMMEDLQRFCVGGNGHFNVDTTFNIIPDLWLTDTSYLHMGLIDKNGNHPEFPGPMMLHFRKDRQEFRTFAMEIASHRPTLINGLKKIGHDLDKATAHVFHDIFQNADHLWCTQHLQERTSKKLKDLNVPLRAHNKIMADIYGTQHGFLEQDGLADAEDEDDFDAKVCFLCTQ